MEKIFDQLADLGMDLEEVFRVVIILASLPDNYDTLVTALEARDEKDLTLSYVKSKLLDESSKNLQDSDSIQEKAFKIQGSRDHSKVICNYCKKEGHIKKNCFKKITNKIQGIRKIKKQILLPLGNHCFASVRCRLPSTNRQRERQQLDLRKPAFII